MGRTDNIRRWFCRMPEDVLAATSTLLEQVAKMREDQVIYPTQDDILNALAYTGPDEVRAVILGQDPYHGPGQAMGLAFSVPSGQKLPLSLRNIYKELEADLRRPAPTSGDLTPWAEQGVLLLNTSLTVREHAAGSHAKLGWRTLTDWVIGECLHMPQPVVFLAWGRPAVSTIEGRMAPADGARRPQGHAGADDRCPQDLTSSNADMVETAPVASGRERSAVGANAKARTPNGKFVLASTHPSPLSANRAAAELPAFMGSRPFSRTNRILEECGAEPIDWTRG